MRARSPRRRLGELLVARGMIDAAQLDRALELAQERGTRLGTQLLMAGWVTEAQLASFLSEQLGLPSIHSLADVDPRAASALPASIAVRFGVLPVRRTEDGLFVALADPSDDAALDAARRVVGGMVHPMVAPELVLSYGIRRFYAPEEGHEPSSREAKPQFEREALGVEALRS